MSFNSILALHSVNDPVRSLEPIVSMARATEAHPNALSWGQARGSATLCGLE